jgi:hypothetical protein
MTKSEVSFLLTAIFVYERRPDGVSQMEVEAWYQLLADVDFQDAKAVVTTHFAESDRQLSPAKIRAGVRTLATARRPPETAADRLRVPDANPDDPKAFIEALKAHRWQPERDAADYPLRQLDVSSLGAMPDLPDGEARGVPIRARRWWLPWGKDQVPPGLT